ncbi:MULTISPECIES: YciI-like protein [Rhodopseudomonas]|uniref:YCII-related domain-containing protein n=1 Tax=Rhodopseudomonas palustris TaxID=1076 RepID=A0A0D7EI30_RHOPL|nr:MULTISPECIES: YciI-like protein [Rhodopseudomonas]KIZ40418.1 hypothetical protein OO17_17760 [Rhodopseudomonas palustris]MDF3808674.1 YciI-like protein [Rhodopseudomonas sp. BAL398]WOK19558.1 YciI-like protein [Rhodopseudomonas sp. BAL398]
MRHFLLLYEYGSDFEVRRAEVREQHLSRAWAASARGELMLAGALAPPVDTGVLLFRADDAATAEDFARSDPYVTNGLVKAWRVREWMTAVGDEAASPAGKPSDTKEKDHE